MPDARPTTTIEQELRATFAHAGVEGRLHAVDLDAGTAVGVEPDVSVVAASVFKLPVLVELCRQAAAGAVSLTQRVALPAAEPRTDGGIGVSAMLDDVDLSLRDLAYLMMAISDNHATDVIMRLLGRDAINATLRAHGFPGTVLLGDCAWLFQTMDEDLGMPYGDYVRAWPGADGGARMRAMRALDPAATNRTTARETTELLGALWREERFDPAVCAEVRRILSLQAWPHRLGAGFPDDRVAVSGKTGTLAHVRNEAGVVEWPGGGRYALAVFLTAPTPVARNPVADRAIGDAARLAVDHLRAARG